MVIERSLQDKQRHWVNIANAALYAKTASKRNWACHQLMDEAAKLPQSPESKEAWRAIFLVLRIGAGDEPLQVLDENGEIKEELYCPFDINARLFAKFRALCPLPEGKEWAAQKLIGLDKAPDDEGLRAKVTFDGSPPAFILQKRIHS